MKETNDLLSVVDELTLSKPVKVPTDDGHTWATEDPLLVQLQEAVSSSLSSGSGSGGAPWTRNVLDSDALHQAAIITSTIGDWCRIAGAEVTRDPVKDLRAWYAKRLSAQDPESFYLGVLLKWVATIRTIISPPKTLEILGACPVCKEQTYTNATGETVRNPLVMIYRPDTTNMHKAARATCRACDTVWQGDEAMEELADELKEGDTPQQTLPPAPETGNVDLAFQ